MNIRGKYEKKKHLAAGGRGNEFVGSKKKKYVHAYTKNKDRDMLVYVYVLIL